MNSLDFFSNKKVWRPLSNESPPIIDVIAHSRPKIISKEEYALKISNIEMQNDTVISCINSAQISTVREKSKTRFVQWSKKQLISENSKTNKHQSYFNLSRVQYVKNEISFEEQLPKQIITVRKEKKIARKVYLKWSKYSSSAVQDNSDHKDDIQLDLIEINRRNHLSRKYWDLWRNCTFKNSNIPLKLNAINKNNNNHPKVINRGNSEDNLIYSITKKKVPIRKRNSEDDMCKRKPKSLLEIQQQKIEEQANLIEELQLARIKLETQKVAMERQSLLKDTSEKCDPKLKYKAKYLSLCNLPSKVDTAKYKNSWQFVTKMELRAEERKSRWNAIKQRKQKLEEEKLEKLKVEEERKKLAEEEEKKRKISQMKLERQRQEEMRKRQEAERLHLNALNLKATEHCNNQLLRSAFDAFKHLVEVKRFMMKEAELYYNEKILFYYFTIWKLFYKIRLQRREAKAEYYYEILLLRKGLESLKQIHKQYISNLQVAMDFNDFNLQKNYFYQWQIFVFKQKHEMNKKKEFAINFYEIKLMQRCLSCWKRLPEKLFLEREKEQRIRLWYNKVQELLPDFQSSDCL